MIWIIALVCLAGGFGFGLYLTSRNHSCFWRRAAHRKLPDIEKSLSEGLLQKREHYEEKVEAEHREIEEKISQDHASKLQTLEESYQNQAARLKENLEKSQQDTTESYCRRIKEQESSYKDQIAAMSKDFEKEKDGLSQNFQKFVDEINGKKAALTNEIEAFEQRQAAIIERFKRDEEARKQRDFFKISINEAAKKDVQKLKALASQFSRPEVLYKLVYEVYYKSPLEELFKQVLKDNKDNGGIYKITNIQNEMTYIGKTTGLLTRWRTHAKRGCNIERMGGLLYEAMFREGLENFTWEIVEICPKESQTEREKYWIEFYKSDKWGYNQRKG